MAADPQPSPASSDRRRRRLTKLEQTQRQHQHSSSSNNSNGRGDPALQDYQRKLAQALFDAEQTLELERHTRLISRKEEEVSLDYNNDDNSLVETASLDSASASFMDNRSSATSTPMDKMKKNLIRNSKKKSVGSPSDVIEQSTFGTDDDDDDDTKTNLDETFFSGYTSTVVSEYTRDTTTAYTRDTSLQRSRDEDETTLFTKDSIKPRVRFDSDTKFGDGDYDNDNDDDNETSDTFDVIKNIVHCRPYWVGGASSSANNNYYTGVVGGIMDDSDTITTRDDATRSVRSTTAGSIFSGGSSSRGEDDYSAMMDTIDTRQTGRDSYWTMESKLDDSTLVTGYTKDTTQSDAELTAKVVANTKPWCSAFTPGGYIGTDDDQGTKKDNKTSARLGSMLFISCVDDYSAMDTMDTGLIKNLSGGKYDCSMLNEYKRKPAQDQNEDQNDDATAANVANHPWVCATDFMGGIMDNIEDTRCEPIARGTMVGSMLSITTAKGCQGKRRDDISAITRGTANSTESDVSQLTDYIKQIMADSARVRQRVEDVEDGRARIVNESARSNKTLAEKLDAVSRGRTHTTPMSERRSFDEVNNNSYGERFEVVIKSRAHEVEPVTRRGRNETTKQLSRKFDVGKTYTESQQREEVGSKSSFWQGDGVWSSDQSTAFGSALTSLPQINAILREYDEAPRASGSADASNCWSAAIDASSGKTYYYNNKTKETSWSMPNGYIGSVRSDNRGKTSVQEQSKMNTHEKNAVNNVISQDIHLSRARTQKQRGGGAFIEERGVTIGSRGSAGRQLDEKQLQTVPAVNALRQLQREESPQYPISQAKTSRGRLPSEKQQSNHHQQRHHHPATTQDQEKKTSRRQRFSLFRKKSAEENTTANSITNTKASPSSAIRPTTANNKPYNKVTTTIDPASTVIDFSWI